MNELILSFLIIAFAFTGLAVGLILKNQPIKGSCGGKDLDCTCSAIQQKLCKIKVNPTNPS